MSGIAGLYWLDGSGVRSADVERMTAALAHRGPDGSGVWAQGAVGLGHRMLWSTPESMGERLPAPDLEQHCVVTADARIDNRDELVRALGLVPGSSPAIGDGALILSAYARWGEGCAERLLGDFAFAIWDRRRRILFCARDHFGVKPFYYHRSSRLFAFASEIKALLCLREVPRRLNEARVADYLLDDLDDKTVTFYEGILRLPPAHTLAVGPEGAVARTYWAPGASRELRLHSDAEYAEAFRGVFVEAVRCRLRSAFPIGSMLSGGLDSSSIACVARRQLAGDGGGKLHTFSAVFPDVPECDERPFIQAVLAQDAVEAHEVRADRLNPLADLDRVFDHEDEAFYAPNLFLHWALYRAARGAGVRVLLDGLDGDLTVSHGIGHLRELARAGRWTALAAQVRGLSANFGVPAWRVLMTHVLKPLAPGVVQRAARAVRGCGRRAEAPGSLLRSDFARRIDLDRRRSARSLPAPRTERESHQRALTHGKIPFMLEVADRAAAAFSLEPRYPFFDRRLVTFCLALPAEQKIRRGWTRLVLRHAMEGILPPAVQWRGGKADLSPNFVRALVRGAQVIDAETRPGAPNPVDAFVDPAAVRRACAPGGPDGTLGDALAVWKIVTLASWLRHASLATGQGDGAQ